MTTTYSNQQLYHMAGENYRTLKSFCELLETEGYWEQAEKVLHLKSEEVLELYVQSLLVCFAVYCKHLSKEERDFVAALSEKNELSLHHRQCVKQNIYTFTHFKKIVLKAHSVPDTVLKSGDQKSPFRYMLSTQLITNDANFDHRGKIHVGQFLLSLE